jgi:hypothetical protein
MSNSFRFRNFVFATFVCAFACMLSACEQNTASFAAQRKTYAADQAAAAEQTAQEIKRLQVAKELDESDALDSDLTPTRRQDFTVRAAKADRAIRELQHGFPVENGEIEEALDIPPRHLTPVKRAQLISQLQQAKALDDKRAQEILLYWHDDEPAVRSEFDLQSERAGEIAKDLELGESVHWGDIRQALYVPADPM